MKETRMVRVIGIQRDDRGEENTIELTTEGTFYEKDNSIYIVYEESQISGMEGTTTTLKVEGKNRVSMKRFGQSTAQLIFEKGKRFETQYHTVYGNFKMEIMTNYLNIQFCELSRKGEIEIHYDLMISGIIETANQLKIQLI